MHKQLHLLGLLQSGPMTGYTLHRIVMAHGTLFTDLKQGNVYYLLERLAEAGDLQVSTEIGSHGRRRERLIYKITDQGRHHFDSLLREVMRTYEVTHSGVEVGLIFLSYLQPTEAIHLLKERRKIVAERRQQVEQETQNSERLSDQLVQDHMLSLINAELSWIERTLARLCQQEKADIPTDQPTRCPGALTGEIDC
jgi:DNA-binding PadR family transcriptional regulator